MVRYVLFSLLKWVIVPVFCLFLFFPALYYLSLTATHATIITYFLGFIPQPQLEGTNVLLFGIDDTDGIRRSDAILVAHLDPQEKRVGVISIPRDTRVDIPGHGPDKINHAYAYGGTPLLADTVARFLQVPIHHYVRVNLKGLEEVINHVGGVEVAVEKDMYYVDKAGGLTIDIKKGRRMLSGKQAAEFARFRSDGEGDIGRIQRQHHLIMAVTEKVLSTGRLFELPAVLKMFQSSIKTDLSVKEMINLAVQLSSAYRRERLDLGTVPGAVTRIDSLSYWRADKIGLEKTIDRVFFGFHSSAPVAKAASMPHTSQPATVYSSVPLKGNMPKSDGDPFDTFSAPVTSTEVLGETRPLRVEVINGYGEGGAGRAAADLLKRLGAEVVTVTDADAFVYDETLLVDWKGNSEHVMPLARRLFIDPANIIVYDTSDKLLDVTIVLGKDWNSLRHKIAQRSSD